MITDRDIEKLKEVFATKEDIHDMEKRSNERFATKQDLKDNTEGLLVLITTYHEELKNEMTDIHTDLKNLIAQLNTILPNYGKRIQRLEEESDLLN